MSTISERVEALSIDLFDAIPSQTSAPDRCSLLAVQRATARRHGEFAYLEIGSHLGGSIQPYLLDTRCSAIYSIDPRPARQPDDRSPGYVASYENNSTERMLGLLRSVAPEQLSKIRCFDSDASEILPDRIVPRPHIAFIDGEHTRRAVLSDFAFCRRVMAPGATILFDDFPIVYPAVLQACRSLEAMGERFMPARLEGKVFALFFDGETALGDPFLRRCRSRSRYTLPRYAMKLRLKSLLPGARGALARDARRAMRRVPRTR